MSSTGLATTSTEYRGRLREQTDGQIDAWAEELMRDTAIRKGVVKVVADFQRVAGLDDRALRRVYGRGGGPVQTVGRDADGRLIVPAIALHCLVSGLRAEASDARDLMIEYLAANFDEIVYV